MDYSANCDTTSQEASSTNNNTKFCKYCGHVIPKEAIICSACGRQVEELNTGAASQPSIVITNTNTNSNANLNPALDHYMHAKERNKWVAFVLCFLLGVFGAHKFYEGKIGLGILYICTMGFLGIGVLIDLIVILTHPNPYYI